MEVRMTLKVRSAFASEYERVVQDDNKYERQKMNARIHRYFGFGSVINKQSPWPWPSTPIRPEQ